MQHGEANPDKVWLFNITADPNERVNLAASMPAVVLEFQQYILSQPQIDQAPPPADPRGCPPLLNHSSWRPWLPDPQRLAQAGQQ